MNAGRSAWYWRGFAAAFVLCGALNGASYFCRSDGGGNLVGLTTRNGEALGFPFLQWQRGRDHAEFSFRMFAANIGLAIALSAVTANWTRNRHRELEALACAWLGDPAKFRFAWQFSIRHLLVVTSLVAATAAFARNPWVGTPEFMLGLLLLGPSALVAAVSIPRRVSLRTRLLLLTAMVPGLAAFTIAVGAMQTPPIDLERTLMAMFICWAPQAVVFAAATAGALYFWQRPATFAWSSRPMSA